MEPIRPSEITPEHLYLSRRKFIKGVGALAISSAVVAACGQPGASPVAPRPGTTPEATRPVITPTPTASASAPVLPPITDELGGTATPFKTVTSFNNFYEFTHGASDVTALARDFKTSPWTVTVGGLVNKPATYDPDDLRRKFTEKERIYRLRCVETWSMVIPWLGFSLAELLREVEPTSKAQYVRFVTLLDPEQMPGQKGGGFPWPYVEGLRLDEAMHDLTLLATGLYGKPLPPQSGAPVRLVVPWKYGFKNIKSIVRIDLVAEQPSSFWMNYAPNEYGFYANVNPDVPHPRWGQATEQRVGENNRRKTLPFNGYADDVAHLYEGMDLRKFF